MRTGKAFPMIISWERKVMAILPFPVTLLILLILSGCSFKTKKQTSTPNPKELALLYLSQNHLNEAKAAFTEALQLQPNDLSNYINLTRLNLLQKNYSDGENLAKAGLKLQPADKDLMLFLAEIYDKQNDLTNAEMELHRILTYYPKSVKAYYALAEFDTSIFHAAAKKIYLLKVVSLVPANIVPRIHLALLLAREKKTDSSLFYLQSVKKIAPAFFPAEKFYYQKAVSQLDGNKPVLALPYIIQFKKLMEITPEYALGNNAIAIPEIPDGYFHFDTNIRNLLLDTSQVVLNENGTEVINQMHFTDATAATGLSVAGTSHAVHAVMAVTDYDADGNMYVYSSYTLPGNSSPHCHLLINKTGYFSACNVIGGIDHKGQDLYATFADYDNDGYEDLFIATTLGIIVFKNQGNGTFVRITENIGLGKTSHARKILFADFDQDGDLDMFVAQKNGNKYFRNNGDGTFTENAAAMGLTGGMRGTLDMDFGDWDEEGDLDIVGLKANGSVELFHNNRHANFTDIADSVGLGDSEYIGTTIAFGDYNNDGRLDILIAGGPAGNCFLLRNTGNHGFVLDTVASRQLSNSLKGIKVYDVAFFDFDNDGYQDILVAGVNNNASQSGVKLFHNEGDKGFKDVSSMLPATVMQAYHIDVADFNYDGDEDIYLSGPSGIQLIRNDGGNLNNYVQVQLVGLTYGNSNNNKLGIGAQIELKAGNLYQLKTVKGALTEFGVGGRTKIDAIRIIWPNGVPQTVVDPTRKQRILEQEQLKGSCPFLFAWNGKKYVFLKDMMWRSALGMPIDIHGTDTTYAYPNASKEYLLIPGNNIKPQNGRYTLKITEELWEAVYLDKVALLAEDHPESVNVYADERFQAPPYPGGKLYLVSHPELPISAVDGRGNNELPKISKYDFKFVSNFHLGKIQGLSKEHDLILNLGKEAHGNYLYLFLRGWIFPADASINTELTQTKKFQLRPPSLQVINKNGKWQTVIKDIGYPMGRDKMVIVNLSGKFLTPKDRRVRIRTNMQIYWDHIFYSAGRVKAPVNQYKLKMIGARLNFRGYSISYRKGGPYGPIWFDYYHVTKGEKWRDLTGFYTRYGDIWPLLQKADDKYVIASPGDQITINFDATHLPPLRKGWVRDFLVYSEGWVKDGDLNTAYGQTVTPLPFHHMPSYPYGSKFSYPSDKVNKEYQLKYNTRKVTTSAFRNALRRGTLENQSP